MRKGLTLIMVGHINFILSAIVHGNVLRHISKPSQQISTEYTVANIISVTSGLLVSLHYDALPLFLCQFLSSVKRFSVGIKAVEVNLSDVTNSIEFVRF